MLRNFLLIVNVFFSLQLFVQTEVGITMPNASAKLEIASSDKGLPLSRMTANKEAQLQHLPTVY